MIAALYVQADGCYANLPGVDPWPEARDARLYAGPHPVVAHPPCARWCQLAPVNQARYGHKVGDDGGCFASALAAVRQWGGILEHPALSRAWAAFNLPRPPSSGGWVRGFCGGWAAHVEQRQYGHRARKATWLYAFGVDLPSLLWGKGPAPEAWISADRPRHELAAIGIHQLQKRETAATPIPFRDLLISIAETAKRAEAAAGRHSMIIGGFDLDHGRLGMTPAEAAEQHRREVRTLGRAGAVPDRARAGRGCLPRVVAGVSAPVWISDGNRLFPIREDTAQHFRIKHGELVGVGPRLLAVVREDHRRARQFAAEETTQ